MASYDLIIKAVDRTGGTLRNIERQLGNIENKSGGVVASFGRIRGGVLAVGAAFATAAVAANKIIDATREYQNIENSLRLISDNADDLAGNLGLVRSIADKTRTSFGATAELFSKLSVATEELGYNTEQVATITTKLSQALAVAGADAGTANGVIRQFGQAMASGTVRGDEFNSIVEGLGPALAIMARESGLTVGELRKLAGSGQLTAEKFSQLLINSNSLTEAFDRMQPTISQLETQLSDAFDKFLVDVGRATNLTSAYESVVAGLTETLKRSSAALNADDNSLASVTERLDLARQSLERLKNMTEAQIGMEIGLTRGIYNHDRALANATQTVEELTARYNELNGIQEENTRIAERETQTQRTLDAIANERITSAQALIDLNRKIIESSVGTVFEHETDALAAANARMQELENAQRALNEAQLVGLDIGMDYLPAMKGVNEAILVQQKRIEDLTAAQQAAAQRAEERLEQQKREGDILYRLQQEYKEKMEALHKVTQAEYEMLDAINTGTGDMQENRAVLSQLEQEHRRLAEALGLVEQNYGQQIASQASDDFSKLKTQLEQVNERLETYSGLIAGRNTSLAADEITAVVTALTAEKEALQESINGYLGITDAGRTYAEFLAELKETAEQNLQTTKFTEDAIRELTAAFSEGKIAPEMFREQLTLLGVELDNLGNKLTASQQYFENLLETANKSVNQLTYAAEANARLKEQLDSGQISLDVYAEAVERNNRVLGINTTKKRENTKATEANRYAVKSAADITEHMNKTLAMNAAQATQNRIVMGNLEKAVISGSMSIEDFRKAVSAGGLDMGIMENQSISLAMTIVDEFDKAGKSLSRSLAEGLAKGKLSLNSFKDFFNNILDDILTAIIQKNITDPLVAQLTGALGGMGGGSSGSGFLGNIASSLFSGGGGGGGNFFGNIWSGITSFFGGFFADGGYLPSGKYGIAGEAGPEIIKGPADVVPMNQLNMGNGEGREPLTVNFNINAIDTRTGTEFLMQNKPQIIGMVSQAYNKQGRRGVIG